MKRALPAHRPAPVSIAREDRRDESIHAIPKSGLSRPKYQIAFNCRIWSQFGNSVNRPGPRLAGNWRAML
jgi:hypothetical protein